MRGEQFFSHHMGRWGFDDSESTLRLDPGVEEIPCYPQIAESTHSDVVAVWEQFDGAHYNIWRNSRRDHQDSGRAHLTQYCLVRNKIRSGCERV